MLQKNEARTAETKSVIDGEGPLSKKRVLSKSPWKYEQIVSEVEFS